MTCCRSLRAASTVTPGFSRPMPGHFPAAALRVGGAHERAEDVRPVEKRRAGGQDADDFVADAVQRERPADDRRVVAELPGPEPMREDDDVRVLAGRVFAGRSRRPAAGGTPSTRKNPAFTRTASSCCGIADAGQVHAAEVDRPEILERPHHVARVPEVAVRPGRPVDAPFGEGHPDLNDAVRAPERRAASAALNR